MGKKKLMLLFLVPSLILLPGCGTDAEIQDSVSGSSTLEEYTEDSDTERIVIEDNIVDYSGSYTEEEQQEIREGSLAVIEEFCRTMFDMDSGTEDYTDDLLALTTSYSEDLDTDMVRNIYPLLQALSNTSSYRDYDCRQFLIWEGTEQPQACAMGFAIVDMENDNFESGEYAVYSQIDLAEIYGEWKISRLSITAVFDADSYTTYASSTDSATITLAGNYAGQFDFTDVEGYLSGYDYGVEYPGEGSGE